MTLYILTEYERNMYHDSYFHAILFDSETLEIVDREVGATAYAGGCNYSEFHYPTISILKQVADSRIPKIFEVFRKQENDRIFEIQSVQPETRVRTLEIHKNKIKEKISCDRCNGSGKWVNPRNCCDQRTCFSCNGNGFRSGKDAIKVDGKVQYEKIDAGVCGTVVNTQVHGKFYRNEHNQPNRSNTTVLVALDDGRSLWVPLHKLRLECDPASDSEVMEKARTFCLSHCGLRGDYKDYIHQLLSGTNNWTPGSPMR